MFPDGLLGRMITAVKWHAEPALEEKPTLSVKKANMAEAAEEWLAPTD
jgi:hypothetical protein